MVDGTGFCKRCDRAFSSFQNALRHVNNVHVAMANRSRVRCLLCRSSLKHKDAFYLHLTRIHPEAQRDQDWFEKYGKLLQFKKGARGEDDDDEDDDSHSEARAATPEGPPQCGDSDVAPREGEVERLLSEIS